MPDLNIFNLDFGNLAEQLNKGRVDKVYFKMYAVAEKLAIHESKKFLIDLQAKASSIESGMELIMMVLSRCHFFDNLKTQNYFTSSIILLLMLFAISSIYFTPNICISSMILK